MRKALAAALFAVASAQAQTIHACAVLTPQQPRGDTARLQAALNLCSPGRAVVLQGGEFESAPLILPRSVTLFLDTGATLLASKNPRDYDLAPGSHKPLIFAYQAAYSGVAGTGVIDGQGVAPELVRTYESQGFKIAGVTLRNAAAIHAAIYKTIGFALSDVRIESGAATGLLLSNAVDANLDGARIRVKGQAVVLEPSILGPTSGLWLRNLVVEEPGARPSPLSKTTFSIDLSTVASPGMSTSLEVKPGDSIQKAIDALPITGGEITVKPGTYREVVTIRKPHVHLHGEDPDPGKTIVVYNNGAFTSGGTFNSSTVFVEADDVTIDHMSLVNDLGSGKGQAVALHVTGDRAIFRNLRISSAQDTLFAASRYCYGDYGPCVTARQYFADCFIEGNIDFIFGDSKAVFERCELHAVPTGNVIYTAQSKHTPDQDSGYIFDHCRVTGAPRNGVISLGRSWRPYATVVFLHAQIDAPVIPAGWTEWLRFGVPTLPTAYYAEFESAGPGANAKAREEHSHQLTAAEAEKWSPRAFLSGKDGWHPE